MRSDLSTHLAQRPELLFYLLAPLSLGALVVFVPHSSLFLLVPLTGLVLLALVCVLSLRACLYLYLATVLAAPPFYPQALGGDLPIYFSNLLFVIAALVLLLRWGDFQPKQDPVQNAGYCYLFALLLSLPFAFWVSGIPSGVEGCFRFVLIVQPFVIYSWLRGFDLIVNRSQFSAFLRFLLCIGAIAAIYGIIDFYFPIPLPHPFAEQYIYLGGERIRRAQGMFYESSSFGNMCAFFLSLAAVATFSPIPRIRRVVSCLLIGVFTTGLFLAYSRASWLNVLVTLTIFLLLERRLRLRLASLMALLIASFIFLVYQLSPELVLNFVGWRLGTLADFVSDPNLATSGRWVAWMKLFSFFADHPWLLLFGIGYKTLPYTQLFGDSLIADNGFMSLTFETGVVGLLAFGSLSAVLLRSLFRLSRRASQEVRPYASFMFAFWCGELVQMLTGDILTYWRNIVIFFAFVAALHAGARPHAEPEQQ